MANQNGNGEAQAQPQQSTALTVRDQKMGDLRRFLAMNQKKIASAIPSKIATPERMLRIILSEVEKTPGLLECTPESFWLAVIQTAQLGLEVGGVLGQAYLIPYGKQCTLVVGY